MKFYENLIDIIFALKNDGIYVYQITNGHITTQEGIRNKLQKAFDIHQQMTRNKLFQVGGFTYPISILFAGYDNAYEKNDIYFHELKKEGFVKSLSLRVMR